ncbi:hypothetical protein [Streptomyces sp. B8F3]|uniref:hypothetical protein n=1 Tax=Streptomyces sp. B8F3 TaxID=3153573 RepID=UPI00325FD852
MPDQLAAQGGAEEEPAVAGEPGDGGAAVLVDHGERGAGPFDLRGGGGEQHAGGVGVVAEHGGDFVGGQPVAYGQLQRLALLGRRAGGLGPGERGQFTAVQVVGFRRAVGSGFRHRIRGGPRLRRL